MSDPHTALTAGVEEDLLPLSVLLRQRGLNHRIYEEGGRQVVAVEDPARAAEAAELYRAWRAGELRIELQPAERRAATPRSWALLRAPVTLLLVALSIAGFAAAYLPPLRPAVAWLTFLPFELRGDQIAFFPMDGQYWRLVTPVFLHFGWLHIAFNCLWLWELGARVERVMGTFNSLMLFLVIALVSNSSQYVFGGPGLFGGMSGVVYGLLGFSWVAPLLQPRWRIQPPRPVMLLMVGWLLLCAVGLVTALGFGTIANAAHFSGLAAGAVLGACFGLLSRSGGDNSGATRV